MSACIIQGSEAEHMKEACLQQCRVLLDNDLAQAFEDGNLRAARMTALAYILVPGCHRV